MKPLEGGNNNRKSSSVNEPVAVYAIIDNVARDLRLTSRTELTRKRDALLAEELAVWETNRWLKLAAQLAKMFGGGVLPCWESTPLGDHNKQELRVPLRASQAVVRLSKDLKQLFREKRGFFEVSLLGQHAILSFIYKPTEMNRQNIRFSLHYWTIRL